MGIGERIKQARVEQGMTVSSLAESARLTKGFISQVETGKANPSVRSLARIAGALRVPLGQLLGDSSSIPEPENAVRAPQVSRGGRLERASSSLQLMGAEDRRKRYLGSLVPGAAIVPGGSGSGGAASGIWAVVISGEIEFSQSPVHTLLASGDVVTWDGARRYRIENKGSETARILLELADNGRLPVVVDPVVRPSPSEGNRVALAAEGPLRLAAMRAQRHSKAGR
jgi:transcriptional regulator with XRE-family HTH domain